LNTAQGQVGGANITPTPEQKAAMCNPHNPNLKFVNTTESENFWQLNIHQHVTKRFHLIQVDPNILQIHNLGSLLGI